MAGNGKSNSWNGIKMVVFILWGIATIWQVTKLTLGLTSDAAMNRQWWLYPVVALLWVFVMIPVGLLVLVLGLLAAVFLGYLMDLPLLMGIDRLVAGHTGEGIAFCIVGAAVLLAAAGAMYEGVRRDNRGESLGFHLVATMVMWLIFIGCGAIPYIRLAVTEGLPCFGR